ncbi:dachshund homolog 2-like [Ornithodoros turicata]|uniref:dachshund homolog 2-like n=1 Tax=Ornithodoros turicata TaxID=34597 RepID=UPI003139E76C
MEPSDRPVGPLPMPIGLQSPVDLSRTGGTPPRHPMTSDPGLVALPNFVRSLYGRFDAYGAQFHHSSLQNARANAELASDATECRLIEYRGEKVAAFVQRSGDLLLCLPQAFDLFLKHLVGGLHTVYTKLKRLGISPIVCNVEQVRILRGLGAIQPGVNRCKLLACKDFDALYRDCTTASSRPGRPPKRSALLGLVGNPNGVPPIAMQQKKSRLDAEYPDGYNNGDSYEEQLDKTALLLNCLRQQMAEGTARSTHASLGHVANNGQPERPKMATPDDVHQHGDNMFADKESSSEMHLDENLSPSQDKFSEDIKPTAEELQNCSYEEKDRVLNLSTPDRNAGADRYSEGVREDSRDAGDSTQGSFCAEEEENCSPDDRETSAPLDPLSHPSLFAAPPGALLRAQDMYSMEALLRNIQTLLRVAADGARHHERQTSLEKAELGMEVLRERELREKIEKQLAEEQKFRVLYQRRLRREKRSRRKVQEQLQDEVKRRAKFEESLRNNTDTLRFISDVMDAKDVDRQYRPDSEPKMHDCAMSVYAPEATPRGSPGR